MKRAQCSPAVKMLLQNKKYILVYKCKEAGLSTKGTSYELAKRLAEHQELQFSRAWKAISNG